MIVNNKIGLGTVQFGLSYGISNSKGQTSPYEVKNILKRAKHNKIDVLDSASAYGNAEEVLGQNDLQEFKVVSKFVPPSSGESVALQLEQSLRNLSLEKLYAYLAHRPSDLLKHPEHWEELNAFKEAGKILKIGFSLNEPHELEELLNNGFEPDLVQVPYNYFDRRFENGIVKLRRNGCEIHTRSTFLQGLFFMDPEDLGIFFDQIKPLLIELQKKRSMLPGQLIKFVIEKPFIDKIILGIETEKQLKENINSIEPAMSLPPLKQMISDELLIPSKWPKN